MNRPLIVVLSVLAVFATGAFRFWPEFTTKGPPASAEELSGKQRWKVEWIESDPTSICRAFTFKPLAPRTSSKARSREVLVIQKGTETVASGSDVFHLEAGEHYHEQDVLASGANHLRKHKQPYRCDAKGRVIIPDLKPGATLLAVAGEAMGRHYEVSGSETDDEPIRIEIRDGVHIRVRAVDRHQRPRAGVPVGLTGGFGYAMATALSERDGRAEIHLDGILVTDLLRSGLSSHMRIAPLALSDKPLGVSLEGAKFPAEEMQLEVPPTGSVRFLIKNPDGNPFLATTVVSLKVDLEKPAEFDPATLIPARSCDSGEVVFPCVGLDLALKADISFPYRTARRGRLMTGRGPSVPGEEVIVEVVLGDAPPVLTGSLMDAEGQVLALRRFEVKDSPHRAVLTEAETDADGRFRFPIREGSRDGRPLVFSLTIEGARKLRSAPVELGPPLATGIIDLGEVALAPLPILAAGRVVDDQGRPVSGARPGLPRSR